MTTIEWLMNRLPQRLNCEDDYYCPCCNRKSKQKIVYELKIDVSQFENQQGYVTKRYKMYYRSTNTLTTKYIGEHYGIGFKTIKEALKDLLTYKKTIKGVKKW